jgi:hypothetical protein
VNGGTVALVAQANGAQSYQWYLNGSPISGATGPLLVVADAASASGTYTCAATNANGTDVSAPAVVSIAATNDIGRLVNISCRAQVGTGGNILIAGYVIGGSGTSGSENVLIRASGPALASFGVAGTLPDPELTLNTGTTALATNGGWAGSSAISTTANAVGAFGWNAPSSHDAAILDSLAEGAYTAEIAGESGDTGVALAEVYDATPPANYTPSSPRLINISARVQVGTDSGILIAGFVIGGSTSKTVLIRGSGPALAKFGVPGVLPDPELSLYQSVNQTNLLIQTNTGWGADPQIAAAADAVGAFSWGASATLDSAILVTLPPGVYSAEVAGAIGDTGVALVEVYEVD